MKAMRSARRRRYVARDRRDGGALPRLPRRDLAALFVLAFLAGALHEVPADPGSVAGIRAHAPAIIGIAVALLVLAGLRSGARGGPLAIEAAEVRYTLLAPISRRTALRPAALAQLRIAVIGGAIFGAVVGNFVFRRFPGSAVEWIGSLAAFGALRPDRRARRGAGRLRAAAAASAWRARSASCSSPGRRSTWRSAGTARRRRCSATWRRCRSSTAPTRRARGGRRGRSPWRCSPRACSAIGGLRLEAARRRAELVAEMRFSASVQDLRTVILLRRQLASEHPRRKPWLRLRGAAGATRSGGATGRASCAGRWCGSSASS